MASVKVPLTKRGDGPLSTTRWKFDTAHAHEKYAVLNKEANIQSEPVEVKSSHTKAFNIKSDPIEAKSSHDIKSDTGDYKSLRSCASECSLTMRSIDFAWLTSLHKAASIPHLLELQASDMSIYWAEVEVGSQPMSLYLDTGSCSTIVSVRHYHAKSAKPQFKQYTTKYFDGTHTSGEVFLDRVSVSGIESDDVAVGQAGLSFLGTREYGGDTAAGILGLAFPGCGVLGERLAPAQAWFDSLMNHKKLAANIFTFSIKDDSSHLSIGDISDQSDDQAWVPVVDVDHSHWLVEAMFEGRRIKGVIDTCTVLVTAPWEQAEALFNSLEGLTIHETSDVIYATYEGDHPAVAINFGGDVVAIKSRLGEHLSNGKNVFSIIGRRSVQHWIFGLPLFRERKVTFDRDGNRIGLSDHHCKSVQDVGASNTSQSPINSS